ncbi:MAG: hypothetical protein ABL955_11680 [Elusimicrobiota bacterium]
MIHALLLAATVAAAAASQPKTPAKAPAFRVQVSSFVALSLREAEHDYARYVLDGKDKVERQTAMHANAAAIAPTFATCGALNTDEPGFPINMVCSTEWMPAAAAEKLFAEGEPSITKSLPAGTVRSTDTLSANWTIDDQKFSFFAFAPPNRTDIRALMLSSESYRHLAQSPLTVSFNKAITRALRELPQDFAGLRAEGDDSYYAVSEQFGPGLRQCRIEIETMMLQCLAPTYSDPPELVFSAAKDSVTAALPAGFSAAECTSEPRCTWRGSENRYISVSKGAKPRTSVRLSIYQIK